MADETQTGQGTRITSDSLNRKVYDVTTSGKKGQISLGAWATIGTTEKGTENRMNLFGWMHSLYQTYQAFKENPCRANLNGYLSKENEFLKVIRSPKAFNALLNGCWNCYIDGVADVVEGIGTDDERARIFHITRNYAHDPRANKTGETQ